MECNEVGYTIQGYRIRAEARKISDLQVGIFATRSL